MKNLCRASVLFVLLLSGVSTSHGAEKHDKRLLKAAQKGKADRIEQALAAGARIEATDKKLRTALMLAAESGRVEAVRKLIHHGASTEARDEVRLNRLRMSTPFGDEGGRTPLILAARKGHSKVVEVLLDGGAQLSAVDHNGESALGIALRTGKVDVVNFLNKKLLEQKAARDERDRLRKEGEQRQRRRKAQARWDEIKDTATIDQCGWFLEAHQGVDASLRRQVSQRLEELVQETKTQRVLRGDEFVALKQDIDRVMSPWSLAETLQTFERPDFEGLEEGLEDINQARAERRQHYARPGVQLLEASGEPLLLLAEKSVSIPGGRFELSELRIGDETIREAALVGQHESLDRVRIRGRYSNSFHLDSVSVWRATETSSNTSMPTAAESEELSVILTLEGYEGTGVSSGFPFRGVTFIEDAWRTSCSQGQGVRWRCIRERKPRETPASGTLHEAAARGDMSRIRWLVSQGVGVNGRGGDGNTALYNAAIAGEQEVVSFLLASAANPDQTSGLDHTTPLIGASAAGEEKLVEILLAAGANVNAATARGVTPLMIASSRGHLEVVKLLLAKGGDVNVFAHNGATALSGANQAGHDAVTRYLLHHGAVQTWRSGFRLSPIEPLQPVPFGAVNARQAAHYDAFGRRLPSPR